jgi:hypothetical protein
MTVAEVITALQELPQDTLVHIAVSKGILAPA